MNRHHMIAGCLCIGIILGAATSVPATAEEPTVCELAVQLRLLLGTGPSEMATLGLDVTDYDTVVAEVEQFCTSNRETVEPLIEAALAARRQAFRAYEAEAADDETQDQDCQDKDQALRTARATLASACANLMTVINADLSADQGTLLARCDAQPLLDIRVRMLDLTAQQRTDLRAAQQTRDQTLRHHKNRKNLNLVKQAHEAFTTALAAILTQDQQDDMLDLSDVRQANLADLLECDATAEDGE